MKTYHHKKTDTEGILFLHVAARLGCRSISKISHCSKQTVLRILRKYQCYDKSIGEHRRAIGGLLSKASLTPRTPKATQITFKLKRTPRTRQQIAADSLARYYINHNKSLQSASALHKRNQLNPAYRIKKACRLRIWKTLKRVGTLKTERTETLIGCSIEQLRTHLESQFTIGMAWNNYGSWHVDHIIPCAAFDLTDTQQQRHCFHYSNLQPLWAHDNHSKNSKGFRIYRKTSLFPQNSHAGSKADLTF